MKKISLLLFCTFFVLALNAQDKTESSIEEQINQQVWEPFKKAYGSSDAELYNSIHTDDVLRVTPWGIKQGDTYKKDNVESFSRSSRAVRTIDFRFEHRIHSDSIAYEVGYYKVVYKTDDGSSKESYGRFHVVLKKEDGQWKIAQDWDTNDINGHKVGAEDFEKL